MGYHKDMKIFIQIILGIAGLLLFLFAIQWLGIVNYEFFGAKQQKAERTIFEQTKSYKHGTIRDLQNLVLEYHKTTNEGHKSLLRDTIIHRTAAFNDGDLPLNLSMQINKIKGE